MPQIVINRVYGMPVTASSLTITAPIPKAYARNVTLEKIPSATPLMVEDNEAGCGVKLCEAFLGGSCPAFT
jgi:hypothetical protein